MDVPRASFPVLVALSALLGALLARPTLVGRGIELSNTVWGWAQSTAKANGWTDWSSSQHLLQAPNQPPVAARPATWPGGPAADPPLRHPAQVATRPNSLFDPPLQPQPPAAASRDIVASEAAHSWPTAQPPPATTGSLGPQPQSLSVDGQPLARMQPFEGAQVMARVGDDFILTGDVLPVVDAMLAPYVGQATQEQLAEQRQRLAKQLLEQLIQQKLVVADAKLTIKDNLPAIEEQIAKHFEEKEVPQLMKRAGVSSRAELDAKLRQEGTSLEQQKRASIERNLSQEWMREHAKGNEDVSHVDLLEYYHGHLDEFYRPARARWQQVSVSIAKYPSKEAAWAAIAQLGNRLQQGASFEELARQHSDGLTAADGGMHGWTSQGSLVAEKLDEAIFRLPLGALSQIIEDQGSLHIVRVVERQPAGYISLADKQDEIRDEIKKERRRKAREEYFARLRKRFPVTTMFEPEATSRLSQHGGQAPR